MFVGFFFNNIWQILPIMISIKQWLNGRVLNSESKRTVWSDKQGLNQWLGQIVK